MTPIVMMAGKAHSGKDTAAEVICQELKGQAIALADPMKRFCMNAFGMDEAQLWGGDLKQTEFRLKLPGDGGSKLTECFFEAFEEGYLDNDSDLNFTDALVEWARTLPAKTTPRHVLQTLGTECVRKIDADLWINYGLFVANELLLGGTRYSRTKGLYDDENVSGPGVVVITDGRFRNELLGVKNVGGLCVRIRRSEMVSVKREDSIKFKITEAPVWKTHQSETEQQSIPDFWFDRVIENLGTLSEFQHVVQETARTLFPISTKFAGFLGRAMGVAGSLD